MLPKLKTPFPKPRGQTPLQQSAALVKPAPPAKAFNPAQLTPPGGRPPATVVRFGEWLALSEMAARRSLGRAIEKFEDVGKPVATLTAWRGVLYGDDGVPLQDRERLARNRWANRRLQDNIRGRGLAFYPVVGVGQEIIDGRLVQNKEDSFVVQPRGPMEDFLFLNHVRELLFNPAQETALPYQHTQYGAVVRLSEPASYLLHHPDASPPRGPQDYTEMQPLGRAKPRVDEPFFTHLKTPERGFALA